MKIILTNYPYQDHQVGDACDFGEEVNKSLVGMGRAVWAEGDKPKKAAPPPRKTYLGNKLRKKVQERKEASSAPLSGTSDEPKEVSPAGEPEPKEEKKEEKKFLQNDLREQVQERKNTSPKKSFWDKLK